MAKSIAQQNQQARNENAIDETEYQQGIFFTW
jgi:hypothetical protein